MHSNWKTIRMCFYTESVKLSNRIVFDLQNISGVFRFAFVRFWLYFYQSWIYLFFFNSIFVYINSRLTHTHTHLLHNKFTKIREKKTSEIPFCWLLFGAFFVVLDYFVYTQRIVEVFWCYCLCFMLAVYVNFDEIVWDRSQFDWLTFKPRTHFEKRHM